METNQGRSQSHRHTCVEKCKFTYSILFILLKNFHHAWYFISCLVKLMLLAELHCSYIGNIFCCLFLNIFKCIKKYIQFFFSCNNKYSYKQSVPQVSRNSLHIEAYEVCVSNRNPQRSVCMNVTQKQTEVPLDLHMCNITVRAIIQSGLSIPSHITIAPANTGDKLNAQCARGFCVTWDNWLLVLLQTYRRRRGLWVMQRNFSSPGWGTLSPHVITS